MDTFSLLTGVDREYNVGGETANLPHCAAAREGADAVTKLIPRSAVEPLVQAKTRGELYDKLAELLAPFGIAIAAA